MNNLKERVTIYQVAQAAHVSLATVSRVINGKRNVTDETREKVEKTIRDLGYKPSGLARGLATNRTTNIGLVIPNANYVYIANMLNGINEVAKKKGFVISLFTTSHSREEAISTIEKVIVSHVDGLIIFDDELSSEDIQKINSYSVPIIVINNQGEEEKTGSIIFSYERELMDIVRSFYEKEPGKSMTFLHVHDGGRLLATCEKAFIEEHEKLAKPYQIINCDDSYIRTYNDFVRYFKEHREGFFVAYRDSIAAAVVNAAMDNGVNVPNDVEVISIVGTKYAHIVRPSITALHLDMPEVGRRAMYMLVDLINGNLVEKNYRFEPFLVKRDSTKDRD